MKLNPGEIYLFKKDRIWPGTVIHIDTESQSPWPVPFQIPINSLLMFIEKIKIDNIDTNDGSKKICIFNKFLYAKRIVYLHCEEVPPKEPCHPYNVLQEYKNF